MKVWFAGLLAVVCLASPAQNKKKTKPPEVTVVETKAHRDESLVKLDGRVRVTAEKPLHGLVVVFDFISPEDAVITSQKNTIDDQMLQTDYEGAFHVEARDPVRAVRYKIRAFDVGEKELRVANDGPFVIE
ncbi:MAG TPA: hypothetical protein VGF59_17190 [Bryobacteraceae bacterium]|jgi:hypothetical protein